MHSSACKFSFATLRGALMSDIIFASLLPTKHVLRDLTTQLRPAVIKRCRVCVKMSDKKEDSLLNAFHHNMLSPTSAHMTIEYARTRTYLVAGLVGWDDNSRTKSGYHIASLFMRAWLGAEWSIIGSWSWRHLYNSLFRCRRAVAGRTTRRRRSATTAATASAASASATPGRTRRRWVIHRHGLKSQYYRLTHLVRIWYFVDQC